MTQFVLLHHPFDDVIKRRFRIGPRRSGFMMKGVMDILADRGHRIFYATDPARLPKAEMLVMHPNVSVLPDDYVAAVDQFPVHINGRVHDIRKRSLSTGLVEQNSDWDGPVIVKSDLNFGGLPELWINQKADKRGHPPPYPDIRPVERYDVFDRITDVPSAVWQDKALVVEKFRPERHGDQFAMRTYIFCGTSERCHIHYAPAQIIKSDMIERSEPVEVPDAIRARRAELGFDFGKLDFVMDSDEAILLDANKTPSGVRATGAIAERIAAGNRGFADAIEDMIAR